MDARNGTSVWLVSRRGDRAKVPRTSDDVFPYSLADIEAELANRTEWVGELLHTAKDGRHLVAASHWSLRSGIVVEVDNDVTSQRRALEARQYLANILDSSDDAIIGKTLYGVITSWNHAAQLMFGYSAEEIVGNPITLLAPPERLEEQLEMLRQIGPAPEARAADLSPWPK